MSQIDQAQRSTPVDDEPRAEALRRNASGVTAADIERVEPSRDVTMLAEVMRVLRDPTLGCPWDIEQDFASIAPYTIEEAYEVADAIERQDLDDLQDELGDLLLQVIYHSQMAAEAGAFDLGDVVTSVTRKMIRRHPHVFADKQASGASAVKKRWDEIKAEERAEKAARKGISVAELMKAKSSVLAGIPKNLPALTHALKLQARAGRVGFDWDDPAAVVDKIAEEAREIVDARDDGTDIEGEIGDLLFAVTNLARHLQIDPENALRRTNAKFERRFGHIEASLERQGKDPASATLDEMEALWSDAKVQEGR